MCIRDRYMGIQGTEYSFPSDVWSIGIILYEMMTGHYPYPLDVSMIDLCVHIMDTDEPTLDESCGYSKSLQQFLSCCLKKNTSHRLGVSMLLEHKWIKENECKSSEFQEWLQKNLIEPSCTETLSMDDIS
eukprot:TRINITY_DN1542_c0_g2_i2.p2 TRINITY_DN1542_c0_g2~~TRINITY_DN1542_c0_g2_i2.p2  ORF type:complete len:130 (+),score=30.61 TRINITY_DN1542_c0_g2_i2:72-461(+)